MPRGMAPPWVLVRSWLSDAWHCDPRSIDPVEDYDDIAMEIEHMAIRAQYKREGARPQAAPDDDGPTPGLP